MEVFLIPVAADRHELYCELPDDDPSADPPPTGFFRGLWYRFREALAEAERERHRPRHEPSPASAADASWYARAKRRTLCRIAETIAEQRLLWHMRRQDAATLVHPHDITSADAMRIMRVSMQSDFEKHRFWLIVDTVLFVLSGLLVVLPGPNVIGYYFGFRLVGHFLSMRGARQALTRVTWATQESAPLAELRTAISLGPDEREARVTDIAARLQLERLVAFFLRTAVPSA